MRDACWFIVIHEQLAEEQGIFMLLLRYLTIGVLSAGVLALPAFAVPSKPTLLPHSKLAEAQSNSKEAAIDRLFKSDEPPAGASEQARRLFTGIKTWMGPYQGVQPEGKDYLVRFERGQLPVSVRLDDRGQIESFAMGCARSTSLNLTQASEELRKIMSGCPNLQK